MATLGATFLTLADALKRTDPDNRIAAIIELLTETNEVLMDAMTVEGNLPTGHRTTVRTGLPAGTWRKLYGGVVPEKSLTKQVDDTAGMLEAYSEVDKSLADLNGNTAAFRLSESAGFVEGMNQTFADTLFYGDTDVNPEKFMGLQPRYDTLSSDPDLSGYNVINGGGTTPDAQTSVWFVTWGERATHLFYPKGSQVGLSHEDKGQVTLGDSTAGYYEGYRDHFKWDVGLSVRDWRGTSRVANIEMPTLTTPATLIERMIDAYYKARKVPGRKVIYMNETIMAELHKAAKAEQNVQLTLDQFEGKPVLQFLGIPIRQVDQITNTEAVVA